MSDLQPTTPKKRSRRTISRRDFLRLAGVSTAATVIAACAPTTAPQPGAVPRAAEEAEPEATATPVPTPAPAEQVSETGIDAGFMRPEGEPTRGGILKTAFGVTVSHFDIHQGTGTHVLCHMYNGLVRYNLVDGLRTIIPDLATSWEIAEDGLTYTFPSAYGKESSTMMANPSARRMWWPLSIASWIRLKAL